MKVFSKRMGWMAAALILPAAIAGFWISAGQQQERCVTVFRHGDECMKVDFLDIKVEPSPGFGHVLIYPSDVFHEGAKARNVAHLKIPLGYSRKLKEGEVLHSQSISLYPSIPGAPEDTKTRKIVSMGMRSHVSNLMDSASSLISSIDEDLPNNDPSNYTYKKIDYPGFAEAYQKVKPVTNPFKEDEIIIINRKPTNRFIIFCDRATPVPYCEVDQAFGPLSINYSFKLEELENWPQMQAEVNSFLDDIYVETLKSQ